MPITLSNIKPSRGSRTRTYRVGRGNASGHGTYSGKGQKGQRARSGGRKGLKLLALKKMLQSMPKMGGFKSHKIPAEIIKLSDLNVFEANYQISPAALLQKGLVRKIKHGVKILDGGEIKIPLQIRGCQISKSAKEKIEKAGGKILN